MLDVFYYYDSHQKHSLPYEIDHKTYIQLYIIEFGPIRVNIMVQILVK